MRTLVHTRQRGTCPHCRRSIGLYRIVPCAPGDVRLYRHGPKGRGLACPGSNARPDGRPAQRHYRPGRTKSAAAPPGNEGLAAPMLHPDWCIGPDRRLDCSCALAVPGEVEPAAPTRKDTV